MFLLDSIGGNGEIVLYMDFITRTGVKGDVNTRYNVFKILFTLNMTYFDKRHHRALHNVR